MSESDLKDGSLISHPAATRMEHLVLADISCAVAICTHDGRIIATSPSAHALLHSLSIHEHGTSESSSCDSGASCDLSCCRLRSHLWEELNNTPLGQSTDWRPDGPSQRCIGFTRYRYGASHFMLLMREITDAQVELRRRLQHQRLQAIGQLVAGIAHDLRAPLASIMFGASMLADRCAEMTREQIRERLDQISAAASRQQETIAGLLDFARLGPPVKSDISIRSTLVRVGALLRSTLREGEHQVHIEVDPNADLVHGNPLEIEQILVNLVLNSIEAKERGAVVRLIGEPHPMGNRVCIHVIDNGPGISANDRSRIFEPFFTTKRDGTGLGLVNAREAARALGGDLELLPSNEGAHFVLTLPSGAVASSSNGDST